MSLLAKSVFGLSCMISASIIGYVHYKQHYDREQLHRGVIRDVEMQQKRKIENMYILQQQIDLTKQLQTTSDQNENNT